MRSATFSDFPHSSLVTTSSEHPGRFVYKTYIDDEGRVCTCCLTYKTWEYYGRMDGGYRPNCKECHRTAQMARNKEVGTTGMTVGQEKDMFRRHGVSPAHFLFMWEQQNTRCKICKIQFDKRGIKTKNSPHIDHCHKTGQIRGLLCHNCNLMLGFAKDNRTILQDAIKYLEEQR